MVGKQNKKDEFFVNPHLFIMYLQTYYFKSLGFWGVVITTIIPFIKFLDSESGSGYTSSARSLFKLQADINFNSD